MKRWHKITGGIMLAGATLSGVVVADNQINPYDTVQVMENGKVISALEITASSTLPEAGMVKTMVDTSQPKITLSKWNGEVSLGIIYTEIPTITTGARPLLSKKIDWSSGSQTMEAVPIAATTTMEDGGMEININLASKPASNVFNFAISGTDDLDFYYQAPLWQEAGLKAPTTNCTDTICSVDGVSTTTRLDNVVDSYAVYYENHANHVEGQTNYATGKAYQIFRPQVKDANGLTTWAALSYSNGVLTVTVPQTFIDSATYPIKVDPTFGYTSIGATRAVTGTLANTSAFYMNLYSISESGSVSMLTKYGGGDTVSVPYKALIYSNVAIYPTTLSTPVGNATTLPAANQWNDLLFSSNIALTTGSWWIGWVNDISSVSAAYFYDTGSTNQRYFFQGTQAQYTTPPASFPVGATGAARMVSIYATYTASGGGGSATGIGTKFIINSGSQTTINGGARVVIP